VLLLLSNRATLIEDLEDATKYTHYGYFGHKKCPEPVGQGIVSFMSI